MYVHITIKYYIIVIHYLHLAISMSLNYYQQTRRTPVNRYLNNNNLIRAFLCPFVNYI